jgi:hypothetical protein
MREKQLESRLGKINYKGEAAQVIRFLWRGGMRYLAIVQTDEKPVSFYGNWEDIPEEVDMAIRLDNEIAVQAVAERMMVNKMTAEEYISMQKNKSE